MVPYLHQFTNPSVDHMPKISTGNTRDGEKLGKETMKLSAQDVWRSNARVAIAQERISSNSQSIREQDCSIYECYEHHIRVIQGCTKMWNQLCLLFLFFLKLVLNFFSFFILFLSTLFLHFMKKAIKIASKQSSHEHLMHSQKPM